MIGKPISEIAAFQWAAANSSILKGLKPLTDNRWIKCSYTELVENTFDTIRMLCDFIGVPFNNAIYERANSALPLSQTTISVPDKDKWKRHGSEIDALTDYYAELEIRLRS